MTDSLPEREFERLQEWLNGPEAVHVLHDQKVSSMIRELDRRIEEHESRPRWWERYANRRMSFWSFAVLYFGIPAAAAGLVLLVGWLAK